MAWLQLTAIYSTLKQKLFAFFLIYEQNNSTTLRWLTKWVFFNMFCIELLLRTIEVTVTFVVKLWLLCLVSKIFKDKNPSYSPPCFIIKSILITSQAGTTVNDSLSIAWISRYSPSYFIIRSILMALEAGTTVCNSRCQLY